MYMWCKKVLKVFKPWNLNAWILNYLKYMFYRCAIQHDFFYPFYHICSVVFEQKIIRNGHVEGVWLEQNAVINNFINFFFFYLIWFLLEYCSISDLLNAFICRDNMLSMHMLFKYSRKINILNFSLEIHFLSKSCHWLHQKKTQEL